MAMTSNCPECSSADLLVVNLIPRDRPMRFSTCRHCENRWWEDVTAGDDVGLSSVLVDLQSTA